ITLSIHGKTEQEEDMKAPWSDFSGKDIKEGDKIIHPSGQSGIVVYHRDREDPSDAWCVVYDDFVESRLCLQIGDKGCAVVTR
ncbi:MAG: hypothetical protein J7L96_09565, partial [Bacteroidales bacterium]|nr:hypothetical protein [Bacteroidales bacterium]